MQSKVLVASILMALIATFPVSAKEWTSASKPGDGSVFTFRGSKIGESMDVKFHNAPKAYQHKGQNYCFPYKWGIVSCTDAVGDRKPGEKSYPEEPRIGDVIVNHISYTFVDGAFCGFSIGFDQANFDTLLVMMQAKYGKPHSVKNTTVHNRMGAAFDQTVAVWNTPHGPMTIERRSDDLTVGKIDLFARKCSEAVYARAHGDAEQKGKSAF